MIVIHAVNTGNDSLPYKARFFLFSFTASYELNKGQLYS